jgi:hypothetical protein
MQREQRQLKKQETKGFLELWASGRGANGILGVKVCRWIRDIGPGRRLMD